MLLTKELINLREEKKELLRTSDKIKGKELCVINDDIDKLTRELYENANFDVYYLGKALATIMSVYENKKFIFQEASTVEKKDDYSTEELLFIIVDKDKAEKRGDYTKHELSILVREGNAIILSKDDTNVFAYNKNKSTGLDFNFRFKKYRYLKRFVDQLIKKRVEEKRNVYSEEELLELANLYLESNYGEILTKLEIDCNIKAEQMYKDLDRKFNHGMHILNRHCKKNKK